MTQCFASFRMSNSSSASLWYSKGHPLCSSVRAISAGPTRAQCERPARSLRMTCSAVRTTNKSGAPSARLPRHKTGRARVHCSSSFSVVRVPSNNPVNRTAGNRRFTYQAPRAASGYLHRYASLPSRHQSRRECSSARSAESHSKQTGCRQVLHQRTSPSSCASCRPRSSAALCQRTLSAAEPRTRPSGLHQAVRQGALPVRSSGDQAAAVLFRHQSSQSPKIRITQRSFGPARKAAQAAQLSVRRQRHSVFQASCLL
jgi:hypothetical protein